MTDEKKKEFTRRLSQCNKSEMIVITYDIFYTYIEEAMELHNKDYAGYRRAVKKADEAVRELQQTLDFKYDLAKQLYGLYRYTREQLALAIALNQVKKLDQAKRVMDKLYDAWSQIAKEDDSQPVMQHTQQVYAGYTYGKNSLNEACTSENSRGFFV